MYDSTKRVAIYARYSSIAQRSESIGQQVDVCRAWCERMGHEVVAVYHDDAKSGRSTEGREQFMRMVDDAATGAFDLVLVYKLDRFARDRYDAAIYRKRLRDRGVEVKSAMESIPDGPEGVLLESVITGVAEWYSADLSQKTIRGMRDNATRCMANGVRVFGYDVGEDGRYVENPAEGEMVRRIFRWWVEGVTSPEIGRRVFAEGFTNAVGRRPGKEWARRVVHDERYLGVYIWDDVRVDGGMPQIVDVELWSAAQRRHRATAAPNRTHAYPLVGRIFDRETGRPMSGYSAVSKGRWYTYYAVNVGTRHHIVRQELVEDAVVRAVAHVVKSASVVDAVVDAAERAREHGSDSPEVAQARRTWAEARRAVRNLTAALSQLDDEDTLTREPIIEALQERQIQAKFAQSVIDRAAAEAPSPEQVRTAMQNLTAFCTPAEIMEHAVGCVVVDRAEHAVIVTLPILGKQKAPNPDVEFSAVMSWLPSLPLGSNAYAWRITPYELVVVARCA